MTKDKFNLQKNKGLNVELVSDTIKYLNENKNSLDIIFAFDLLEHIPPEQQISYSEAIFNALKFNGMLLATVPNANSLLGSRNRYIDYTHYVTFTEISLDFILYNGGFKKIEILEMDFIKLNINPFKVLHWCLFKTVRLFRRISFIAELGLKQGLKVPLSFNLMARATKQN